jgi:hypothetical protein
LAVSEVLKAMDPKLRAEVEALMQRGVPESMARQQVMLKHRGWVDLPPPATATRNKPESKGGD